MSKFLFSNLKIINKSSPNKTDVIVLQDEYSWIRDSGWPKKISNSKVKDLLEKENQDYQKIFTPLQHIKNDFYQELKSRIKLADQSVYIKRDNYYYFSKTEEDKNYPIYFRTKNSPTENEEILLDVNKIADGQKFCSIGSISVSPDHKMLAYSVDYIGDEKYTIFLKDLNSNILLNETVPNTINAVVWNNQSTGFFYTKIQDNWKQTTIYFHRLGTDYCDDRLVFQEKKDMFFVGIKKSSDKNFLIINVKGHEDNEIYCLNLNHDSYKIFLIRKRTKSLVYEIDSAQGFFYMSINDKSYKDFSILRANNKNYDFDSTKWKQFIDTTKEKNFVSFDITKNYLIVNYRKNFLPLIHIYHIDTKKMIDIKFDEESFDASAYSTNFLEDDIRIKYSSLKTPQKIFSYDYKTRKLSLLKETKIPTYFNSEDYQIERIFAENNLVKIPITILYKKSLFKKDGSNYLYLNGYGAYGISNTTSFRNLAISIANMGIVYAIAHIRGGSEMGYEWYLQGKLLNKKNSFTDFINASEELFINNYTAKGKIIISGGSAGGMLIGNVLNAKSHYYKAAILHVPFVDVLNTMLDKNLPLTTNEFKEWGNPEEKKYFDYIKSYCPYQNIQSQKYPHLYVTTALNDTRVGYWEAVKWIAKIRKKRANNDKIILLKINMASGHAGASKRFEYLKDLAEELTFIKHIISLK